MSTTVYRNISSPPWDEDYVWKVDRLPRMSNKALADLAYAVIMTRSRIKTSYGVGIYQYQRAQNVYNGCEVLLHVPQQFVETFETMTGRKLYEPATATLS